jgi:hypothetical protein
MKVLSMWEPWATLYAMGLKRIEIVKGGVRRG